MPRVVVLGTGTGVGKTHVTVTLARALENVRRASVLALKPIETGVRRVRKTSAPAAGSDAAALEAASGLPPFRPHPLYALPDPVSAHLAARRHNTRISLDSLSSWVGRATLHATALRGTHWALLETAGGAFSPVTARLNNVDLARRLDPAIWILVAPDSLGVFHDVRATLLALRAAGRAPDYLVLSSARAPDVTTGTNRGEFHRLGLPHPIAVLSRTELPEAAIAPLVRALLQAASRH